MEWNGMPHGVKIRLGNATVDCTVLSISRGSAVDNNVADKDTCLGFLVVGGKDMCVTVGLQLYQ